MSRLRTPAILSRASTLLGAVSSIALLTCAVAQSPAPNSATTTPPAPTVSTVTTERGFGLFQQRCMSCHGNPAVASAPLPAVLREYTPERIYDALNDGVMKSIGATLTDNERRLVAQAVSGRLLGASAQGNAHNMPNRCAPTRPFAIADSDHGWNGWGADLQNTRFRSAQESGLASAQIPRLALKWAFGLPNSTSAYGQPTVVGGRVFFGTDTGYVYSLDARSGCVYWSFLAKAGVRNAMTVARQGFWRPRYRVYFGDIKANVYAIDADSGQPVWTTHVDSNYTTRVTAAPSLYRGQLFVPVSSWEEYAARTQDYGCCTSVGSVVALDARSGRVQWQRYVIAERPHPVGRNSRGVEQFAPAGGSVWNTPTVDPQRHAIYIGTGDATTFPAAATSDSVMALDMASGKVLWTHQVFPNDSFLLGCVGENRTDNCPRTQGPDWDVPGSPILTRGSNSQRLLIVATKPGDVLALDPDRSGELVWRQNVNGKAPNPLDTPQTGGNKPLPGMMWGGATDGQRAYFGLTLGGGLVAVDLKSGVPVWQVPLNNASSSAIKLSYAAAATAVTGAVFAGGSDGSLIAVSSLDGRQLWNFDTRRDFDTVNHIAAHGGSIGAPGATVADGMVFVGSGYAVINGQPGNVLLAFAPTSDTILTAPAPQRQSGP